MTNPIDNPIPIIKVGQPLQLGPPDTEKHLIIVPKLGEGDDREKERMEDETPRKFQVSARFARGDESHSNLIFNFDNEAGDSHFTFPENSNYIEVETSIGQCYLFANKNNRLSTARFTCTATSVGSAGSILKEIILLFLDHLAYKYCTPIHLVQISAYDETHKIRYSDVRCPYPEVVLGESLGKITTTLAPVYAMYREAINASSPFYKFFCFYKILEGLLKPLKAKIYTEAKQKSVTLPSLKAIVPSYEDIPEDQKPYVGKPVKRFFDEFLTNRFRNDMAHFILDEGAVLNVSNIKDRQRYTAIVHVAKLCCDQVISHFETCVDILEGHEK